MVIPVFPVNVKTWQTQLKTLGSQPDKKHNRIRLPGTTFMFFHNSDPVKLSTAVIPFSGFTRVPLFHTGLVSEYQT
jgi:hypothetical protein